MSDDSVAKSAARIYAEERLSIILWEALYERPPREDVGFAESIQRCIKREGSGHPEGLPTLTAASEILDRLGLVPREEALRDAATLCHRIGKNGPVGEYMGPEHVRGWCDAAEECCARLTAMAEVERGK